MHPSAPGYLNELRRLAEHLFQLVCVEFAAGTPVTVRFDSIDDLADQDIEEQHLVATALLCAQLLHRVTADPKLARPRHVHTLTDILEQVIPPLASTRPAASAAANGLYTVGDRIARTAFNLMLLADPDSPDYDAG